MRLATLSLGATANSAEEWARLCGSDPASVGAVYSQPVVVAGAARVLVLAGVGVVCGFGGATLSAAAPSTGRSAAGDCSVTIPTAVMHYGSRTLAAVLPRGGKMVVSDAHPPLPRSAWFGQIHADGLISVKLAWFGSARGQLRISGARLDARARPLLASVATGTPHFWRADSPSQAPGAGGSPAEPEPRSSPSCSP
jgi:hypothetical protein